MEDVVSGWSCLLASVVISCLLMDCEEGGGDVECGAAFAVALRCAMKAKGEPARNEGAIFEKREGRV